MQVIDTHTHQDTQADAGNNNTRRPTLASGKKGKRKENAVIEKKQDGLAVVLLIYGFVSKA